MERVELIAEIGWNHQGDMALAEDMICAAKEAGADYAKFQTWRVSRLIPGPWDSDGRREAYEQAELSPAQHYELRKICDDVKIKFLTSCFCRDDLPWLAELMDEVKIPSTECANGALVRTAAQLFKRVFVSTGATGESDYIQWRDVRNVWLLHCVAAYPCPAENVNLPKLERIRPLMQHTRVGYSGHYPGIEDAVAAIACGAKVVEKHFTTDRELFGRDSKYALLPDDFKELRRWADLISPMREYRGHGWQEAEETMRRTDVGKWG